ncbi:Type 1 glutamine amidotransferase-like domain-containing protein [bacterium]|nr:Type 1 glutamine amidotransferase-like domain-containing protein [bacterium]
MLLLNICLVGQVFDEKFEHWPLHTKINGRIVILNEVGDTTASDKFVIDASGKEGAVVGVISVTELSEAEKEGYKSRFAKVKDIKFVSLQESDFDQKLGVTLKDATVALLDPPNPVTFNRSLPLDERVAVPLKRGFSQLLQRSGTLVAEGQWAKLISKRYLKNGDLPEAYEGLDLFPDSIVDTNFETQQDVRRLKSALVAFPKSVGIGISNDTTLVCSGRKCFVLNQGKAKFLLSANTRQPQREQTIQPARNRREMTASLVDLTQWRRDAIDRELEPFPPATPKPPVVENGTLVIVGGGGMPRNLMSQIVDMAGGPEKAKMVYVPCAEQDDVGETQRTVEAWKRMGVKHATFIHTKDRNKANSDEEFLAPLKDATGIWFGGGRQWNFADSYYGTKAHQLMKDVLKRGGVIGGSSAGASIQARYLARATPIGNFQIMAPGYERGGLGFISGVAIDQHFSQRGRQKDMTTLMAKHPQLLGIGLDEATAIIVKKSNAKVVGRGKAHFYDRNLPVYPDRPDYVALPAGSEYELSERKVIADTSKLKSGDSKDEESKSKAEPETPPKNS